LVNEYAKLEIKLLKNFNVVH